jgi:hypothetical protein
VNARRSLQIALIAPTVIVACTADKHKAEVTLSKARPRESTRIRLEGLAVTTAPSRLHFAWKMPAGTTVNEDAPFRLRWRTSEGLATPPEDVKGAAHSAGFDVELTPTKTATQASLLGDVELVVCDADTHKVCVPVKRELQLDFSVGADARTKSVEIPLPEARAQ